MKTNYLNIKSPSKIKVAGCVGAVILLLSTNVFAGAVKDKGAKKSTVTVVECKARPHKTGETIDGIFRTSKKSLIDTQVKNKLKTGKSVTLDAWDMVGAVTIGVGEALIPTDAG